jgi:hypothetical protein
LYSFSKQGQPPTADFGENKKERESEIYFSLPILKICLPQEAQVPLMAGLPFFSLICLGFLISRFFFFS